MSESFETFYEKTKKQYTPTLMEYTGTDMEALREQIVTWLRPSYEQALKKQEKQAALYNGKLDADAWSRGMGSSTYVSDLKYRRQNELQENRANLEASYGAALAEQLVKAWEKQLEYRMEVEKFNAQAKNEANEKALTAAEKLYQSYLTFLNNRSGSTGQTGSTAKSTTEDKTGNLLALEKRKLTKKVTNLLQNRGKSTGSTLIGSVGKIRQDSFVQE